MTIKTRIERIAKHLGDTDPGPLVFISSNAWPESDRTAYAAAMGEDIRGRARPDVARLRAQTAAAAALIERRTGITLRSHSTGVSVIDVPAPDDVLALDDEAREAWLDQHESRAWRRGSETR
jgi:hypothetical protein